MDDDGVGSGTSAEERHRRLAELIVASPPSPRELSPTAEDTSPVTARLRARLERLCALAVSELGVDGAGVTVMGTSARPDGARTQLCILGPLTARLDELQLTTGEGPCLEAHATGVPVLVAELVAERSRWLGFTAEALAIGTGALFSFPLQVGAVRLGTLDLNRRTPGPLTRERLADALTLAALATELLLALVESSAPDGNPPEDQGPVGWLPDVHADVHVASGMVSAHTGLPVREALLALRAHAYRTGESISSVARRVIDRDLVLDPDHPPRPENGAS